MLEQNNAEKLEKRGSRNKEENYFFLIVDTKLINGHTIKVSMQKFGKPNIPFKLCII